MSSGAVPRSVLFPGPGYMVSAPLWFSMVSFIIMPLESDSMGG